MNILAITAGALLATSPERGVARARAKDYPGYLPRAEHKVLIEAADPEVRVLTAQTVTYIAG